MSAGESFTELGARGIALARQVEGAETKSEIHPMTAPEYFSELGFRCLCLAKQAENSRVLLGILEGQIKQQQQAIEEAQAVINSLRRLLAAEAVPVPIQVVSQAAAPGD